MYIIIMKKNNLILEITNKISFLDNEAIYSIQSNMSYPNFLVSYVKIDNIPENIEAYKYKYINNKFLPMLDESEE